MLNLMATGRLTSDPEARYGGQDNQTCVVTFNIVVDRRYKKEGQPEADFHKCIAIGRTAEFIDKYFTKGRRIGIAGTLQNNNYTDKEGVKRYGYQIVVSEAEFVDSKQDAGTQATHTPNNDTGFMSVPEGFDDGLPFN